jgi:hypothetical protein
MDLLKNLKLIVSKMMYSTSELKIIVTDRINILSLFDFSPKQYKFLSNLLSPLRYPLAAQINDKKVKVFIIFIHIVTVISILLFKAFTIWNNSTVKDTLSEIFKSDISILLIILFIIIFTCVILTMLYTVFNLGFFIINFFRSLKFFKSITYCYNIKINKCNFDKRSDTDIKMFLIFFNTINFYKYFMYLFIKSGYKYWTLLILRLFFKLSLITISLIPTIQSLIAIKIEGFTDIGLIPFSSNSPLSEAFGMTFSSNSLEKDLGVEDLIQYFNLFNLEVIKFLLFIMIFMVFILGLFMGYCSPKNQFILAHNKKISQRSIKIIFRYMFSTQIFKIILFLFGYSTYLPFSMSIKDIIISSENTSDSDEDEKDTYDSDPDDYDTDADTDMNTDINTDYEDNTPTNTNTYTDYYSNPEPATATATANDNDNEDEDTTLTETETETDTETETETETDTNTDYGDNENKDNNNNNNFNNHFNNNRPLRRVPGYRDLRGAAQAQYIAPIPGPNIGPGPVPAPNTDTDTETDYGTIITNNNDDDN